MTSSQLHMEEERVRRLAANEATFRDVNERVAEIESGFGVERRLLHVLCECAHVACTHLIDVPLDRYEATRANPARFLVLPEHVLPDFEDAVERGNGYVVVQKREGPGADEARRRDPRTR